MTELAAFILGFLAGLLFAFSLWLLSVWVTE